MRGDLESGGSHRAIDLAVAIQLFEKAPHERASRVDGDLAIHGNDRWDARLSESRPERGGNGSRIAGTCPGTLA